MAVRTQNEQVVTNRIIRQALSFDEVSLVPGSVTIDPALVDISTEIGSLHLDVPFLAAAMDGVVDVNFAVQYGKLGGLAVLNLDGLNTRYEDPASIIERICKASKDEVNSVLRQAYQEPVKEELIEKRIKEIKKQGVQIAVSTVPGRALQRLDIAQQAGADLFVVQGTVTTARHVSPTGKVVSFEEICEKAKIPVVVGNCVSYQAAIELMECGIDGILVGVGPGAACTTRNVLGVGVPQITATLDVARARDDYYRRTGKYVAVITDGGMRVGGDIAKAMAAGADAVMLGSPFAAAAESASKGYNWGMATPDPLLPRGTRIHVGVKTTLKQLIFGPAEVDDGSQNLAGALRAAIGICGARNIKEFHQVEMVFAPSIRSEGKLYQQIQGVGMGN